MERTTWKLLEDQYEMTCLYTPPYSPFLNPIELLFNVVKARLKKKVFRNSAQLAHFIDQECEELSEEHCERFIHHCQRFYPVVNRKSLLDPFCAALDEYHLTNLGLLIN